jgi:hypothetical protein
MSCSDDTDMGDSMDVIDEIPLSVPPQDGLIIGTIGVSNNLKANLNRNSDIIEPESV